MRKDLWDIRIVIRNLTAFCKIDALSRICILLEIILVYFDISSMSYGTFTLVDTQFVCDLFACYHFAFVRWIFFKVTSCHLTRQPLENLTTQHERLTISQHSMAIQRCIVYDMNIVTRKTIAKTEILLFWYTFVQFEGSKVRNIPVER